MSRVFRSIIKSNAVFPVALALLTASVTPGIYQIVTYRSFRALGVLFLYETSVVSFVLLWLLIARAASRLRGWPFPRAVRITGLLHAGGLLMLPYAFDFQGSWNRWGAVLLVAAFGLTAAAILACLLPPLLVGRGGWRPAALVILAAGFSILFAAALREEANSDRGTVHFLLAFETALVILFSGAWAARSFTGKTRRLLLWGIPITSIVLLLGGYSILPGFRRRQPSREGAPTETATLEHDRGGFRAVSAPGLRRVLIGDEFRDAFPAVESIRLRSVGAVPDGAVLEAGFGIVPLRPGPLPGPDAFRLVIGNAERDTVITPPLRGAESRLWTDIGVPLDGFAGGPIDLDLRFVPDSPGGERPTIAPFWSPPRMHVPGARLEDRPNLLLITIDALRADHMGCYGYDRPTTPNLDRFAAEGVRFTRAITQAPFTLPAAASILSSLYPMTHGVAYGRTLRGVRTLPLILHEQGYRTAAFVDNPWLDPPHGFDVGFDRYVLNAPLTDPAVEGRIREWLATADGPFFLWLHYLSPHAPYRAHPEYFSRIGRDPFRAGTVFPADDVERYKDPDLELSADRIIDVIDLYDSEIWYADRSIGDLLGYVEELGVLDRTVVAVTADHGEEFKDHGGMGHSDTLFEELIHVPLLLRYPAALPAGRTIDTVVETIDLSPTLLDLLGVEADRSSIEGESLLDAATGGASGATSDSHSFAFSDRPPGWLKCVTDGGHKLVRSTGGRIFRVPWGYRRDELYDLAADPRELVDRIRGEPEIADRLRGEMSELLERSGRIRRELESRDQKTIEFSEDQIERMKALGYIQ